MITKIKSILVITLLVPVVSCNKSLKDDPPPDPPTPVTVYRVEGKDHISYYDSYPATAAALREVEVRGQVGGYITGIYFEEGKPVRKGQKLYEIDRSKYLASEDEAKANLEIAETNLAKVQLDYNRYEELSKQDAIAKQRLDYVTTDLQNARLQVLAARSELTKATEDLGYSLITSPFEGTIGISAVKLGSLVIPGQTLMNTISSDDPIGIDFVINDKELNDFEQFQKQQTVHGDSVFTLVMPDNSIYSYPGSVYLVDRAFDPETSTIKVRLAFPNPERRIKPGMSSNVRVLHKETGPQTIIPYKSVVEQMGEFFVFKADSNKAEQVKINLGQRIGDGVIVKNGISPGDYIVVDGLQKIHNGSGLEIDEQAKTTGKVLK